MNGPVMDPDDSAHGLAQTGSPLIGDPLDHYAPPDPAADVFASASPEVAKAWHAMSKGLADQCQGDFASLQQYLDRHVEELGMAFRHTGDEAERPWPLNPVPIILGNGEWAGIERGLIQRANLLEAVIADLYGRQQLVTDGHLPAAVISGSSNFARRLIGMTPPGGHFLHIYGADLARGPDGEWRVLADRVRLPVGIGYALENRLALGRATGGMLGSIGSRRHAAFFDALREGIAASCSRADPRMALLTPGRFSQSYPEQAHLARYLGISLVEGRDLAVSQGKLYVRTIAGLKRIDALWRWISTRDIDPLHFDSRSQIGVPNLMDAAGQNLVLANWPGSGVVESRAMSAFLPRLAEHLNGESLILPNVATWWCGGAEEQAHVRENLDNLMISSAFLNPVSGLQDSHMRLGSSLSAAERAELEDGLLRRPMDYIAQEVVSLSTTPMLSEGQFVPRGFTIRAFLARSASGEWTVLQGGLARVSQSGELRTSLMGLGDIASDLCVVEPAVVGTPAAATPLIAPAVRRDQGLLPSQAADNLFWLGRYSERAHQTVRIIRSLLDQVAIAGDGQGRNLVTAVTRLANLLRSLEAAPKESEKWQPSRLAGTALSDSDQSGSVLTLTERTTAIALLLRDRLTRDSWRAIQCPIPYYTPGDIESMSNACDRLIDRFAALSHLLADGFSRGPAWSFLEMGVCLERASMILQAARGMVPGSASAEDLSALLDLVDGQSLYRSRYVTMPFIAPVLDMIVLDPVQPLGFAYQIKLIEGHLSTLPSLREDGLLESPIRQARQLRAKLEGLDAQDLDLEAFEELRQNLARLSDAISHRYFLQNESPVAQGTLLG